MNWAPASREEVLAAIERGWVGIDPIVRKRLSAYLTGPEPALIERFGSTENAFVVARIGRSVVFFEDIEEVFGTADESGGWLQSTAFYGNIALALGELEREAKWDGDWSAIDSADERKWAEDELRRELCPTHALYGLGVTAIGRRWRRDDVLFRLDDGRLAQVHLTRTRETEPSWPATQIYSSFQEWTAIPLEDR